MTLPIWHIGRRRSKLTAFGTADGDCKRPGQAARAADAAPPFDAAPLRPARFAKGLSHDMHLIALSGGTTRFAVGVQFAEVHRLLAKGRRVRSCN